MLENIKDGQRILRHRNYLLPYIPKTTSVPHLLNKYRQDEQNMFPQTIDVEPNDEFDYTPAHMQPEITETNEITEVIESEQDLRPTTPQEPTNPELIQTEERNVRTPDLIPLISTNTRNTSTSRTFISRQ